MSTLYEAFNDDFEQLPVKIYKHNLNGQLIWTPLHWHRSVEILVTFKGQICFNVGSDNFNFAKDNWLIINSSELHSCRYIDLVDHFEGISFLISHSFLEKWLGKDLFFSNPHIPEVTKQIKKIANFVSDLDENAPNYSLIMMGKIYELLLIMSTHCIKENTTYKIPFTKNQNKITELLEYIEINYKEDLSLNQVAEHFKYSPSYFSKFFKEAVGMNYLSYLNYVRVRHAGEELLKERTTLTQCALNNGFPNTKSFITMFKKLYGCTPGKFLKN